jgi:hypothetical protein
MHTVFTILPLEIYTVQIMCFRLHDYSAVNHPPHAELLGGNKTDVVNVICALLNRLVSTKNILSITVCISFRTELVWLWMFLN